MHPKDLLEEIFMRQQAFQELIGQPTAFVNDNRRAAASNIQLRRAEDEIGEALREIPYDISNFGQRKKLTNFSRDRIKDELADAFLFMVNAMNILDISSQGFLTHCQLKQTINVSRFKNKERFRNIDENFFIIIEGPDGVGKTEICKQLSMKLGYPIIRMPDMSDEVTVEEYSQFFRSLVAQIPGVIILDRFYPSSIVYGQHFGRTLNIDDVGALSEQRDMFVFIIDSDQPFRGDTHIDAENWKQIRKLYLENAKLYEWKVIKNDTTLENCLNAIIGSLQF